MKILKLVAAVLIGPAPVAGFQLSMMSFANTAGNGGGGYLDQLGGSGGYIKPGRYSPWSRHIQDGRSGAGPSYLDDLKGRQMPPPSYSTTTSAPPLEASSSYSSDHPFAATDSASTRPSIEPTAPLTDGPFPDSITGAGQQAMDDDPPPIESASVDPPHVAPPPAGSYLDYLANQHPPASNGHAENNKNSNNNGSNPVPEPAVASRDYMMDAPAGVTSSYTAYSSSLASASNKQQQ